MADIEPLSEDEFKRFQEQLKVLIDIRDSLRHLSEVVKEQEVPQPARAILNTQIFLLVQKVRYLLGEKDE